MTNRAARWRIAAWLVLALSLWPGAARAMAGTPVQTCLLRAAPGMSAPALFAQPARFDCRTVQTDLGPGDYWVLSGPLPAQSIDSVRVASLWQERTDLYVRYADGAITRLGYTSATTHRVLAMGAIISLAVPQRAVPPVRLLWHIHGAMNLRGIVVGAAVADRAQVVRQDGMMTALYAAFVGMAMALLLYNLALWGAIRQAFLLAYCLMVGFLLVYALSISGVLGTALAMDNNLRLRCNCLLLAAATTAAMTFARTFFERRVFDGWLRPASTIAVTALLLQAMAFALLAPAHALLLDRLGVACYSAVLLLVGPILWQAWRQRSDYLFLFALAWSAPIMLASVRIVAALHVVAWNFWIDNSTLLAMALEAALSSLAIAYRIRQLSRERDHAQARETAAWVLADTDPLTGLLNRRAFLGKAIGRPGQHQLVIVDVDHFKRVNETIGHDGGDDVLRVIARTLVQAVPAGALIARLGGEEFAIICTADAPLDPAALLDALRVARMPFDLSVTASVGTCSGPLLREPQWQALYRAADRALFDAKAAGRDRVRAAPLLLCA